MLIYLKKKKKIEQLKTILFVIYTMLGIVNTNKMFQGACQKVGSEKQCKNKICQFRHRKFKNLKKLCIHPQKNMNVVTQEYEPERVS